MRPPAFWTAPPGWQAAALAPLAALYAAATARRVARPPKIRPEIPVICVGNISAGGTGKTPTVIALIGHLARRGIAAEVVTRGHGGRLAGPVRVDPARHTAADVGDEPLLLAAFARLGRPRPRRRGGGSDGRRSDRGSDGRGPGPAARRALLLDDGHQNPDVARALSLIVIDAATGFGNGRVLPAGPLREPVAAGLARADLALAIGSEAERAAFGQVWRQAGWAAAAPGREIPLIGGELRPLETGMDWQGLRVLAFAGIGRPEKFFATLRGLGADPVAAEALDDHQPLSDTLMTRLERQAAGLNAQLVTTEKDAARLPPAMRGKVLTLPVRLAFVDAAPLDAALDRLFPA